MSDDEQIMPPFERLPMRIMQSHPPTVGEKLLASTNSHLREQIKTLVAHPFFKLYRPNSISRALRGKAHITMSFQALQIEMVGIPCHLSAPALFRMAEAHTQGVGDEVVARVQTRLDRMVHVYQGTTFKNRRQFIQLYQAVWLLERDGLLANVDPGCLTGWAMSEEPHWVEPTEMNNILSPSFQKKLWEYDYPLLQQELHSRDNREEGDIL